MARRKRCGGWVAGLALVALCAGQALVGGVTAQAEPLDLTPDSGIRYLGYHWAYANNPPANLGDYMAEVAGFSNLISIAPYTINTAVDASVVEAARRASGLGLRVILNVESYFFGGGVDVSDEDLLPNWKEVWEAARPAVAQMVAEGTVSAFQVNDEPYESPKVTRQDLELVISVLDSEFPAIPTLITEAGTAGLLANGVPAGLDLISTHAYNDRAAEAADLTWLLQNTSLPILLTADAFDGTSSGPSQASAPTPNQQQWYVDQAAAEPRVIGVWYFAYSDQMCNIAVQTSCWNGARYFPTVIAYHKQVFTTYVGSTTAAAVSSSAALLSSGGPLISAVTPSNVIDTEATITWTTDVPADSLVKYGTTAAYGSASGDGVLTTSHRVTLSGLSAGTLYYYRVQSSNASGNLAISGDLTLTTSRGILSLSVAGFSVTASPAAVPIGGQVTVAWTTPSSPTLADLIGLFVPGAPDSDFSGVLLSTGGLQNGSLLVPMPPELGVGVFEFRLFRVEDAALVRKATSNPVTVVDTLPPGVDLERPLADATVSQTISLQAFATDDVGIARVWFQVDGVAIPGTATDVGNHTYVMSWDTRTVPDGLHVLTAVARDVGGNEAVSTPVTVRVLNDTIPPTVTWIRPLNGAVVWGTQTLSVDATDNVGVVRVVFTLDGVMQTTFTDAPYTRPWDTRLVSDGRHTWDARAFDAAGNNTVASVTVTVDNAPPTYTLSASPSSVGPSGSLTVTWTASGSGAGPGDWIGLYAAGAPNPSTAYLDYRYVGSGSSGTVTFVAPSTPGSYEARYLPDSGYTSAKSVAFTVQ